MGAAGSSKARAGVPRSRRFLPMAFLSLLQLILLIKPVHAGVQFCAAGASPPSNITVLVLMASTLDASYTYGGILRNRLRDTGAFGGVDYLDVLAATPTVATMSAYSAVLLAGTGTSLAATGAALGDALADYWDAGGAVVVAHSANADGNLQGRFAAAGAGYLLLDPAAQSTAGSLDSLGSVLEAGSPLLVGTESMASELSTAYAARSTATPVDGSVVVAQWSSDSRPLVIRGARNGRSLVRARALSCVCPSPSRYPASCSPNRAGRSLSSGLLTSALLSPQSPRPRQKAPPSLTLCRPDLFWNPAIWPTSYGPWQQPPLPQHTN
jgi:hypothetical protein